VILHDAPLCTEHAVKAMERRRAVNGGYREKRSAQDVKSIDPGQIADGAPAREKLLAVRSMVGTALLLIEEDGALSEGAARIRQVLAAIDVELINCRATEENDGLSHSASG
jgi:hypothetical protein